ncbi:MAG TPA: helix-turn-helix transcriptional regulator [Anaeromyxobacter sp.]|nr:helix-turn-helix transcriptional regulator [Anaeromyxobacter sp.]
MTAPIPVPEDRLPAFGRWLARERELRGLARDEVARATKLAPGVVEALESGEEGRVPPRAYAVGYLRAYASAVGLDADEVVLRYEEAAGSAEAGLRRAGGRSRAGTVLGISLACIAAAVVAWALLRR